MQLRKFSIDPSLHPFLALIWVFESTQGLPPNDLRIIAPDGEMKVIIPFRNWITSRSGGALRIHAVSTCSIVGQQTVPAVIDSPSVSGIIGITLKPAGAYRFFRIPLHEVADRTVLADELFGREGCELHEQIDAAPTADAKVGVVQRFLLRLLRRNRRDEPVVDWMLDMIDRSGGCIRIDRLSEKAGYTRRQIDRKFADFVGLSPKTVANIVRFQRVYSRALSSERKAPDKGLFESYYDQSHYIKEFKRFSGHTPGEVEAVGNRLGELFISPRFVPFLQY